jgi:predicted amidohydrolase YtcJ
MRITLFYNCLILTVDKIGSTAESICILDEKILSVGTEKEVRQDTKAFLEKYKNKDDIDYNEVNLDNACIVPGFIDAHMHPVLSIYYKTQLQLSNVKSYSELGKILKREDKNRDENEWILGFDFMENSLIKPEEHFFPDRYKLDELCPNRPLVILRYDGHICTVNSLALEKMGINKLTIKEITLDSGEIQIDGEGKPTGILTEGATSFALEKAPVPSRERFQVACKKFTNELSSYGVTSCGIIIQAGGMGIAGEMGRLELPMLKYLLKEGLIEQDLVFYIVSDRPKKLNRIQKALNKLTTEEGKLIVGGLKLWADGSFGALTALMYEPFSDSPEGRTGLAVVEKDKLYELYKESSELGYHSACHAIGDKANRIVIDVYERILKEIDDITKIKMRLRIEHASLITDDMLADAAKLGIILVCQPAFIDSEYTWLEKRLGPERIKYVYPLRSIINSGVILAGASDAPIESADVLRAIQVSITRNGFIPEQAITAYEGLKMFTWNAAYALGQEKIKGSLEKGKLADFVVLDQDITAVPSEKIADIKILGTYHRGKKIYSSD